MDCSVMNICIVDSAGTRYAPHVKDLDSFLFALEQSWNDIFRYSVDIRKIYGEWNCGYIEHKINAEGYFAVLLFKNAFECEKISIWYASPWDKASCDMISEVPKQHHLAVALYKPSLGVMRKEFRL